MRTWLLALLVVALVLAGCAGQAGPANGGINATNITSAGAPAANASPSPASPPADPVVVFETTKGTFTAKIYANEAPITGGNFMKLVRAHFYDNLTFHRVVPGFVAQGGDPNGDGSGGSNQTIPLEIVPGLKHTYGALAMARTSDPNSASSQFYICLNAAACAQLDGSYAVFGQVQGSGMSVVNQLNPGEPPAVPDRMIRVYEQPSQ
ncbi:MAG: peptidylprolyl isomerase [Candidatus Micrarchaeota archaeon]|nr:peptidylprolyl isomerase [Candidatus Micrarchaeota archaeon]